MIIIILILSKIFFSRNNNSSILPCNIQHIVTLIVINCHEWRLVSLVALLLNQIVIAKNDVALLSVYFLIQESVFSALHFNTAKVAEFVVFAVFQEICFFEIGIYILLILIFLNVNNYP